jgi:hypothetical protein
MAETLPEAAGTPREVEIRGTKVNVWPFMVDDFAAWDAWARGDFLRGCEPHGQTIKTQVEQRLYQRSLLETASQISFGSFKALGAMQSIYGKFYACLLSLQHGDPTLTKEAVWTIIMGPKLTNDSYRCLNRMFTAVMKASGLATEEADESDPTAVVASAAEIVSAES